MSSTVMKPSLTPELTLQGLKQRVHTLLAATSIANDRANIVKRLLAVYRKIAVAQLLYDRYVIAIAGLQGVGKSTLLKQLYDLSNEYVPENMGRGEKLPVLITEHEESDIRTFVRRAVKGDESDEYNLENVRVSPSVFHEISKKPAITDMWLELMVPKRYFSSGNTSFLLLPGMEETTNEDEQVWQDFMQHALTMASTCVLVFDRTKLAQADNQNLIASMIEDFQSAKPIFALTRSDMYDNNPLKSSVMERFSISSDEENRVILTGTGGYPRKWTGDLIEAIRGYSSFPRAFRHSQMTRLSDLLEILEQDILPELQEQVEAYDTEVALQTESGSKYNAILNHFDQEASRVRRAVDKEITKVLDAHQKQAFDQIRTLISNRKWPEKAITFFFGKSYKEHQEFMQAVQDAWESPSTLSGTAVGDSYLPFKCSSRIEGIIQARLGQHQLTQREDEATSHTHSSSSTVAVVTPKQGLVVRDDLLKNIEQFFKRTRGETEPVQALEKDAALLIPIIALEQLNRSLMASPFITEDDKGSISTSRPEGQLWDELNALSSLSPGGLLNGIAYVFGFELAEGAAVNTVPALLGVLGIEATTAAVSVASGILGLLGLGLVASTVTRQVTKQQFQDEDLAITLTKSFQETYHQLIMDHYDEVIMQSRERLENQVQKNLHIDDMFRRWERLRYAVSEVMEYQLKMREMLNEHLDPLG